LIRELAKTQRVATARDAPVVVEIESGGNAGV
jgi:hypothetical protein